MRFERRSRTTYRPTVSPSRSTHVDSFTGTTSSITVARTRQEYQPTRYRGVARWGEALERMPVNDRLAAAVEYRVVVGMLDFLTELERRLDDGCPASRNCSQPTCTRCSAIEKPSPGARPSRRCTPKTSCSPTRKAPFRGDPPSTTKQQLFSLVSPWTSSLSKMASDTSAQTSERSRGHSARLAHQLPAASMSSPSSTGG